MSSFWLIDINLDSCSLSYIDDGGVIASTTTSNYSLLSEIEQIITTQISSSPFSSSQAAFVLPSSWVGIDGKIIPQHLLLVESICRQLSLSPLGFVGHDEAIIENLSTSNNIPPSFVLLNLVSNQFILSLVYLGQVKNRIHRQLSSPFSPSQVESCLLELKSDITLPPQIIVFGSFDVQIISDLQNYPWLGRRDISTFLHLPEVKHLQQREVIEFYKRLICSQLGPSSAQSAIPDAEVDLVDPSTLGFAVADISPPSEPDTVTSPQEVSLPLINNTPRSRIPRISLPHFSLPRVNHRLPPLLLIFLILPLLAFIFFYKVRLTIYVNPYNFSERLSITLDSQATSIDSARGIIPINVGNFKVSATADTDTTGKITTGTKAQGEIVIFNSEDKVQNIPRGSVLIDNNGNKFELFTATSVASSSSNLDAGIITLGQTKSVIVASSIGEEYNLSKDTKIIFKDYPSTKIFARVVAGLTGGAKRQTPAVAAADKTALTQKLPALIESKINQQIESQKSDNPNIIVTSLQIKKDKVDFNREVGEEADTITASQTASVTFFYPTVDQLAIIKAFLATNPSFSNVNIDTSRVNLSYEVSKLSDGQATGYLVAKGHGLPKVDTIAIQKASVFRTPSSLSKVLRQRVDRFYNYKLVPNFILPIRPSNIIINIDTGST